MADRLVNVTLTANTVPYVAGMNRAAAATQRAAASTATMSAGMKRTGASMAQVAGGAGLLRGGFTTPLIAAGAAVAGVAKASIDWESAWAGVTKTVDGSEAQMSALQDDLRGMARELPATHGEIAKVAEAAGQLGVGVEDVADFSRVMVDLGETTNLSADQAATSIARLTNIMGTAPDDVERLGSTLVDLGNNSATTEAEILVLGQRLAAAGNIAGLSESDVLAFAATLTSVGVNAEAGGTALSKTFTTIRDAVLNGGAALETFAEVAGVSAQQFADAFRADPAQAIALFIEGLGRMNAAGKSTTGVFEELQLTDQRLMRALLSTAEAGDLLSDSIELASDAWDENIALTEEAEKRYATTASRLSTSWNKIKDTAIDSGEPFADLFADLTEGAADFATGLQKIDGWLEKISGTEEQTSFEKVGNTLRDLGVPEWLLFTDFDEEKAEAAVEWNARFKAEIEGLANRLPAANEALRDYRTIQAELADVVATGTEKLAAYQEQLRRSTDPVFALHGALEDVDAAQEAYNDAVEEYGKNSPEAESAAFDLATAVAAAETAALDGELSFDAFDAKLQRWVDQGVITAKQADNIRDRVKDLRGEAEDYEDTYTGQFKTGGVSKARAETQGLLNRANRWHRTHTATFQTGGTSKAQAEINGLLNRAYAFHGRVFSATVNIGATGSGLGVLFGSRFVGHDGGRVTTSGIRRFHDGSDGVIRAHDGVSLAGLASDEVPAVLQTGEVVLSRRDVAAMANVFGSAASFHNGGMVGGGLGAPSMELRITGSGALFEQIHEGVRNGQVQLVANGTRVRVG